MHKYVKINDGISSLDDSAAGGFWHADDASTPSALFGWTMATEIDGIVAVDAIDGVGVFNWTDRHNDITIVQFNSA